MSRSKVIFAYTKKTKPKPRLSSNKLGLRSWVKDKRQSIKRRFDGWAIDRNYHTMYYGVKAMRRAQRQAKLNTRFMGNRSKF